MSCFFLFLNLTVGVSSITFAIKTLSCPFLVKSPRLLLCCLDMVLVLVRPSFPLCHCPRILIVAAVCVG